MDGAVLGWFSLAGFVGTIILGILKKRNLGILAVAVAFLMGFFVCSDQGALSSPAERGATILSMFPFQVFWQTLSVSLMLNVGTVNGTFQIIIRKLVGLARGKRKLIPAVVFLAMMIACSRTAWINM